MRRTCCELELIQPHMAQKPVLRGEVGCVLRVRSVSREEVWASAGVQGACIVRGHQNDMFLAKLLPTPPQPQSLDGWPQAAGNHPPKRLAHPRSPIPPLSALTSRATHAHPTSPRSTGFCAIWGCISSSSPGTSPARPAWTTRSGPARTQRGGASRYGPVGGSLLIYTTAQNPDASD